MTALPPLTCLQTSGTQPHSGKAIKGHRVLVPSRCCNHRHAPSRADLQRTCHQKGETQPPSTWLQESSCTSFKAHLLIQVSPCSTPSFFFNHYLLLFCPYQAPFNKCPAPSCCCWPCSKLGLGQGSPAGSLPPQ